jgi:hypothetical protein
MLAIARRGHLDGLHLAETKQALDVVRFAVCGGSERVISPARLRPFVNVPLALSLSKGGSILRRAQNHHKRCRFA